MVIWRVGWGVLMEMGRCGTVELEDKMMGMCMTVVRAMFERVVSVGTGGAYL